jgi:malonate transporter and related proteins
MQAILINIVPVFALIALGFGAARSGYVGPNVAPGMLQFVFNLAIPALLFRTSVNVDANAAAPWVLWMAFFGAVAIVWLATTALARLHPALADAGGASAAMATTFGNVALLGLPLAIAHFGKEAAVPVSLLLSIHAPLLWLVATLHMESARQRRVPDAAQLFKQLFIELAKNPIVIALLAAALWRWGGLGLHPIPDKFLELLGNGGIPAALVALGLSLSAYSLKGQWSAVAILIALKMLLLPLIVWAICTWLVALPPLWKHVAIMLAAMPTGANAYLFAKRYESAAAAVSGNIALGTALAIFTTAALLQMMDWGWL